MFLELSHRVESALRRRNLNREVEDEIAFHIEMQTRKNIASGMEPQEARRGALLDFGGAAQVVEECRDRRATSLDTAWQYLWHAARGLRSGRGTTALAFVILTLTMAAGIVTFSVVDAVALRRLPYGEPGRLVDLTVPSPVAGRFYPASPQAYFAWLDGTHAFESLGAAGITRPLQLELDGRVESLATRKVTANLFDVLGIRPALGRFFGPEHERPGGPAGVILGYDLWVRRFGAERGVIGRQLTFGDERREVIGVLPKDVWYPISLGAPADLYVPYVPGPLDRSFDAPRRGFLDIVGRLGPGVTLEQARADANRIFPAVLVPLQDRVVGPAKVWLLLVLAAVGVVLLGACANVAILLLSRAAARAPELATREALGASRGRLAAGLFLEGLLLALASAASAVLLSFWGVQFARSILPRGLTRVSDIAIDGRVLGVSIFAAFISTTVFASGPAWLARKSELVDLMKGSGGAVAGGRRRDRALSAFLVADIAFVCTLVVVAALVVTSFRLITTADLGFDRQNVAVFWYQQSFVDVSDGQYAAAITAFRDDLLERAKSVAGVTRVALSNGDAPLSGSSTRYSVEIPGYGKMERDEWLETRAVTPDYFRVMGIELIRGRLLEPSDRAGSPPVMLINDVAARRFFGSRDPIGQIVTLRGPTTIVGIVKGVRVDGPGADLRPEMYVPLAQDRLASGSTAFGALVVRTSRDVRVLAPAIREAIRPALGGDPTSVRFVDDYFRRLTAGRRFNAQLMAAFGFIAVAIGAIGVYGTMAFFVGRRMRAIGIHMALGASPSDVMGRVLGDALRRVALGVLIGLAGAWAASGTLEAFVFGIRPTEPSVYLAVAGFLALVGVAAALAPAVRAARLDPVTSLRHE